MSIRSLLSAAGWTVEPLVEVPLRSGADGTLDDASRAALRASGYGQPRIRIATKHACANSFGPQLSNGTTQVSGTERLAFELNADVRNLRFMFRSYTCDGPYMQITPVGNPLKIYACLEANATNNAISLPTSIGEAISTGGRTAAVVPDGGFVTSEPVSSGVLAKGSTAFYRVHKTVGAGEKWLLNGDVNHGTHKATSGVSSTDFVYGSTVKDGTDQTKTFASQAWGAFAANAKYYAATAIIGEQVTPTPVCLIVGDSIANGMNSVQGRGYIGEALTDAGIGYQNAGCNSLACNYAAKSGGGVLSVLPKYADHILCHCLTNDIYVTNEVTTLDQAKLSILGFAKLVATQDNKLWFATLLPRNTSSDSFTTYANQTIADAAKESLRIQVNNWLRDSSSTGAVSYLNAALPFQNVAGTFDPAKLIERNSDGSALVFVSDQQLAGSGGRWLVDGTPNKYTEGIHPSASATSIIKESVPVGALNSIPA